MCFDGPDRSIKSHEVEGPSKHIRFFGPSKHMRFLEGKNTSGSIKTHEVFGSTKTHEVSRGEGSIKTNEVFRSTKTHEVLKGEKLDLGPSNHVSFLGPPKHMRFRENTLWSSAAFLSNLSSYVLPQNFRLTEFWYNSELSSTEKGGISPCLCQRTAFQRAKAQLGSMNTNQCQVRLGLG